MEPGWATAELERAAGSPGESRPFSVGSIISQTPQRTNTLDSIGVVVGIYPSTAVGTAGMDRRILAAVGFRLLLFAARGLKQMGDVGNEPADAAFY